MFLELLTPAGTRCAIPGDTSPEGHVYVMRKNGTPKRASGTGVLSEVKGERFGVVAAQVRLREQRSPWRCRRTCDDAHCVALEHHEWQLRKA